MRYDALPASIRKLAHKNFNLLNHNPDHPSLHFKYVGNGLWSARVGMGNKVWARAVTDTYSTWFMNQKLFYATLRPVVENEGQHITEMHDLRYRTKLSKMPYIEHVVQRSN